MEKHLTHNVVYKFQTHPSEKQQIKIFSDLKKGFFY